VQATPPVSVRDLVSVHELTEQSQPAQTRRPWSAANPVGHGSSYIGGNAHNHLLVRRRRVSAGDPARQRTTQGDWRRVETRRQRLLELLREMRDADEQDP
jgi:hypothetical protein